MYLQRVHIFTCILLGITGILQFPTSIFAAPAGSEGAGTAANCSSEETTKNAGVSEHEHRIPRANHTTDLDSSSSEEVHGKYKVIMTTTVSPPEETETHGVITVKVPPSDETGTHGVVTVPVSHSDETGTHVVIATTVKPSDTKSSNTETDGEFVQGNNMQSGMIISQSSISSSNHGENDQFHDSDQYTSNAQYSDGSSSSSHHSSTRQGSKSSQNSSQSSVHNQYQYHDNRQSDNQQSTPRRQSSSKTRPSGSGNSNQFQNNFGPMPLIFPQQFMFNPMHFGPANRMQNMG